VKYFAHSEESAVCREDENGVCFAKLWTTDSPGHSYLKPEYKLGENSNIRNGNPDYMSLPVEISKEDYDTFGITWIFGAECGSEFTKVTI
jgi:hypothetical protein